VVPALLVELFSESIADMKFIRVIKVKPKSKKYKKEAEFFEGILNYLVHEKIINEIASFGITKVNYENY